jgi:hypothetical protein
MHIQAGKVRHTLEFLQDLQLVSAVDAGGVLWLLKRECPFSAQLEAADSIHAHVKVADTAGLPRDAIINAGGIPENEQRGYVKFAFAAGINMIFSSIPVAEDDCLPGAAAVTRPLLDHAGVDLRRENVDVRRRFDAVSAIAQRNGWRHVAQGGAGRAVHCCHTQVSEKHWVYPPAILVAWTRPLEFAFGPLRVHAASRGCDLRPIDPAHAAAAGNAGRTTPVAAAACCKDTIACCGPDA